MAHPLINSQFQMWLDNNPEYRWYKNNGQDHVLLPLNVPITFDTTSSTTNPKAPCTFYVNAYNEAQYPNRNGIYWVREEMSIFITSTNFLDVIAHLNNGSIVKMTEGIPNPASVPPNTGLEETHLWQAYQYYQTGDVVFFNDEYGQPDYSVYYISALDNNVQGIWAEKWDIKTGSTHVKGLYSNMMGPRVFIEPQGPTTRSLRELSVGAKVDTLRFNQYWTPDFTGEPLFKITFADGSNLVAHDQFPSPEPWPKYIIYNRIDSEPITLFNGDTQQWERTEFVPNNKIISAIEGQESGNAFWDEGSYTFISPRAPKIKGLLYLAQENADTDPIAYVFDGFVWRELSGKTSIPRYDDSRNYMFGDVVAGKLYGLHLDTGTRIDKYGIFRRDLSVDDEGNPLPAWTKIRPYPLYDSRIDDANPSTYYPAWRNGQPITLTKGEFFYVYGTPGPGQIADGIYEFIGDHTVSISVDLNPTHEVFHDLFDHSVDVELRTGGDISMYGETITGTNDIHNYIQLAHYNWNDILMAPDNEFRLIYRCNVYNTQTGFIPEVPFNPNEKVPEWICLADLHSTWEYWDEGVQDEPTRVDSYLHIANKESWPPFDSTDSFRRPREDTIYIDKVTWGSYIFKHDNDKGYKDYIPLTGSDALIEVDIPDPIDPDGGPASGTQDFILYNGQNWSGPVYLMDPNEGEEISLLRTGNFTWSLPIGTVKNGALLMLKSGSIPDMRVFVKVISLADPDWIKCKIVSAPPYTQTGVIFDLNSIFTDPITAENAFLGFYQAETGSIIDLPVEIYYRQGTFINAEIQYTPPEQGAAMIRFNVTGRVIKHTWDPAEPIKTRVELIARYNDPLVVGPIDIPFGDGGEFNLVGFYYEADAKSKQVTRLVSGFQVNTGRFIPAGIYNTTNPWQDVHDPRVQGQRITCRVVLQNGGAYSTEPIESRYVLGTATLTMYKSAPWELNLSCDIPGSDMMGDSAGVYLEPVLAGLPEAVSNKVLSKVLTLEPGNPFPVLEITGVNTKKDVFELRAVWVNGNNEADPPESSFAITVFQKNMQLLSVYGNRTSDRELEIFKNHWYYTPEDPIRSPVYTMWYDDERYGTNTTVGRLLYIALGQDILDAAMGGPVKLMISTDSKVGSVWDIRFSIINPLLPEPVYI